jgi:molybdopterin synthase catalytic subunit
VVFEVTRDPITAQDLEVGLVHDDVGAVVTFLGVVRGNSKGKKVLRLEYDAYEEMAVKTLRQIGDEIRQRWDVEDVAIRHRIGPMEIGETSLVVVVAAAHRAEAFSSARYAVDRIKEIVPVWKKEFFEDGEVWVGARA